MSDNIEAFLTRLQHPSLAEIDLSLDRMRRLLSILGSPQKRLPPVIHVAGTNGKGSLLAYLLAIFEAAGYRVHRYTSPHLVHFRERIVLAGKEVENSYLEQIVRHITPILQTSPATFFEATTAIAFLAFAEHKADIVLLETGMGGRLDATNILDKPLLTAITPISLDHCEFLGNSITAIAGEKAGILKREVPCVVGRQMPEALSVIEKAAAPLSVPLYRMGQQWQINGDKYESPARTLSLKPALAGAHQYDNAATAVACIDKISGFTITDAHIAQGLANARWPARLQRIDKGAYVQLLPPGMELWLDGGHNPQGGEALAEWVKYRGLQTYLVCGMMKRKDTAAYLKPLVPYTKALYAVGIAGDTQAQPPEQVEMAARGLGMEAYSAGTVEKALQTIRERAKTPCIICICGSLYLAGKVLGANG